MCAFESVKRSYFVFPKAKDTMLNLIHFSAQHTTHKCRENSIKSQELILFCQVPKDCCVRFKVTFSSLVVRELLGVLIYEPLMINERLNLFYVDK
jgi:hypothetical protein